MEKLINVIRWPMFFGYLIIFESIEVFGKTDFLSWEMFAQIVMVAIGGTLIASKRS